MDDNVALFREISEGYLWDGRALVLCNFDNDTRCHYEWIEADKLLFLTYLFDCEECGLEHMSDQEIHQLDFNPLPELFEISEHADSEPWYREDVIEWADFEDELTDSFQ